MVGKNVKVPSTTLPKNLKVLMVDDNELNWFLARVMLKKVGWQMDTAQNGIQALEKLKTNHYDLVLMDIQMPEMDGVEATLKIRKEITTTYSQIPIIACTPITSEFKKWMEAGMNDYISKPFNAEELISKVLALVNNSSSSGQDYSPKISMMESNENAGESPLVNLQKLISFSGKSTVRNIIQVFLKQVPDQVENLITLVKTKNWNSVKILSHKMKSSYAVIGANSVRALLDAMEAHCEGDNVDESKLVHLMEEIIVLNEKVIKNIRDNSGLYDK